MAAENRDKVYSSRAQPPPPRVSAQLSVPAVGHSTAFHGPGAGH